MKNKSFSIVCIFLLITLFLTSSVFANSSIKCQSCDATLSTNLDYDFSSIKENGGKHLSLLIGASYKDEKYVVAYWSYDSNIHNVKPYLNDGIVFVDGTYNTMIYKVVDGSLVHQGWSGGLFEKNGFDDFGKNLKVFSTSADIYSDKTCTDVFFYKPPATLEEIMRVEADKKATIQEILGVLPLILVVVVSFLGLRKALNWLLTLLRRS